MLLTIFIIIEFTLWIILLMTEPVSTALNIVIKWLENRINKEDKIKVKNKKRNNKKGKGLCICGLF